MSEPQPEYIVRIAGMDLPAKTIMQSPFELRDLALLSVDEQRLPIYLQMRRRRCFLRLTEQCFPP
jgi:hypothetical protein